MSRLTRALSMLALTLVCCLSFVGPAAAASPGAPIGVKEPLRPAVTNVSPEALERAYQAELAHLARQDRALTKATTYLDQAEAKIADLKADNYDTTALEETLVSSRASVVEARTEWTAASAVLEEHPGFDDAGKVTDAAQARTTLERAASFMRQVHQIGKEALATIQAAIEEFLQDNPGFTFPKLPGAPPPFELRLG
jgi:hypothetical protein